LAVGLLLYGATLMKLRDVDLYWHLRAGLELLNKVPPRQVGADWSYAADPKPWVTTQWLAEVTLRLLFAAGSWPALVAYREITASICVAILAFGTLRGRPTSLAAFPFLIAATAAIATSQERSNQATLLGAALLGPVLARGLKQGQLTRWWLLLPGTWIWANFHGGWILVPMTFAVVALSRALDHGMRDQVALKALGLGTAATLVGTLTPAGAASTLAIFRFSAATDAIEEWQPTAPLDGLGYLTAMMAIIIIISLSRSSTPRSVVLASVVFLLFSWTAVRNVAPALLLLAPLVADRLSLAFPRVGREPEPRWSAPAGVILAATCLVAGLGMLPGRDLLPRQEYPVRLAGSIKELPGAQRVLNDYNASGLVLFLAGTDDQVGIDGRTDRYGSQYIEDYIGLKSLHGDWESMLEDLDPTCALIEEDTALAHVLVEERGWTNVGRESGYVLLVAPGPGV
jgi:hypothetical protein